MTHPRRRLIKLGGPAYKVLVRCDPPDLGTLLVCVVVPFPPGAEPHSDVLHAATVAADVRPGQVLGVTDPDAQGRPLCTGASVAFVVRSGMPRFVGRIGEVATLPVFLGFRWPGE